MIFNPDPSKPTQKVLFSRKKTTQIHPTISFNNIQIARASYYKYLYILFHEKLNFSQHVDTTIMKINKDISVLKTQKQFATEILNDNLHSIFKAPN